MSPDGVTHDFGGAVKENLEKYVAGSKDTRDWGTWEALSVKVENDIVIECEKRIIVNPTPMGILSLQMHEDREEIWTVEKGILTVIRNGEKIILEEGESIFIPRGAIHCMINETGEPVVVHEVQKGICREADNHRLEDAHGRKDSVDDTTHAETFLKTMTSRHDADDHHLSGDRLMNVFMNKIPTDRMACFISILNESRTIYKPFADEVVSLQCSLQNRGNTCA